MVLRKIDFGRGVKGCTNEGTALVLNSLFNRHAPTTKVLLHRDRDYLSEEEMRDYKKKMEDAGMSCFFTKGKDIESYYFSSEHINLIYPKISIERARQIIDESIQENEPKSIESFINSRINSESDKRRKNKAVKQLNPGEISREANKKYHENPRMYCHGKSVFGVLRSKIQKEIGGHANLFKSTEFLKDEQLAELASEIWKEK